MGGYHNMEETAPGVRTAEPTEIPEDETSNSGENTPKTVSPSSPTGEGNKSATAGAGAGATEDSGDEEDAQDAEETEGSDDSVGHTSWSPNNSTEQTRPDDDVTVEGPVPSDDAEVSTVNVKLCNINNIPLSTLMEGITVPEGCALLADKDLATVNVNPQYNHATIFLVCATKDAGHVRIDSDVLSAYDMIFEGSSILSSMVLDAKSEITLYPSADFEGGEKYYNGQWSHVGNQVFSFAKQKYHTTGPPFINVMDNIHSLVFKSNTDKLSDCNSHENINRYKRGHHEQLDATEVEDDSNEESKIDPIDHQLKLLSKHTHQNINKEFVVQWLNKHSHYTIDQITPQWLKDHPSFLIESQQENKTDPIDHQLKLLSKHQNINKEFLVQWLNKHPHYTIDQITPQWLKDHPSFVQESTEWKQKR